ncbi:PTS transporter subunit EIIC [Amedibacillus sp. YH-ame10]
MAKKEKYEDLANSVVDLIGGKDNVMFFTHCVTRLRFNLKDQSVVKTEQIEGLEGVIGVQWQNGQLQIIIGQAVGDAYKLICEKSGLKEEVAVNENNEEKKEKGFKGILNGVLNAISGCLTPAIPVLIGCGMIKVLVLCIQTFGWLSDTNATMQILTMVGDAGFYFLPIIVGSNAAKKFGANQGLGMVIGAMLIYPTFVSGVAEGISFNFFGLPIYGASYTSTIFPVILCVWVMAPIERFFAKISPESLRSIIQPLCTILVMIPITFCLLAPAGAFLGNYVSEFVIWLYETIGFVGVAVLAAFMPFIVMTGMHSAFVPYLLQMFGSVGYEPIFFTSLVLSNINQGAASLAVALKSKNKSIKSTGVSCAITAIVGGVSEPAMYGINLKYKTPMWGAMIGSAIAGLFAGIMKVYIYAFAGSSALFAIPCFISENGMNVILICVSIVIGIVSTFIATYILYKEGK